MDNASFMLKTDYSIVLKYSLYIYARVIQLLLNDEMYRKRLKTYLLI